MSEVTHSNAAEAVNGLSNDLKSVTLDENNEPRTYHTKEVTDTSASGAHHENTANGTATTTAEESVPEEAHVQEQEEHLVEDHRSNVYVGNLSNRTTEDDLQDLFHPFGNIVRCKIGKNRTSLQHAGYGFVQFDSIDSARNAIAGMNNVVLFGRNLKVSVANPPGHSHDRVQTNLYVCALPLTFTDQDLSDLFTPYGNTTGSRLLLDPQTGASRGVGFIRFESHEDAQRAIHGLNGTTPANCTEPITVKFAREKNERRNNNNNNYQRQDQYENSNYNRGGYHQGPAAYYVPQMGQGYNQGNYYGHGHGYGSPYAPPSPSHHDQVRPKTNLYISGIPETYSRNDLELLFSQFGRIIGSRILTNSTTGASRGIGFVRFDNHQSASDAIKALDGQIPQGYSEPFSVKFARENNSQNENRVAMRSFPVTGPYAPAQHAPPRAYQIQPQQNGIPPQAAHPQQVFTQNPQHIQQPTAIQHFPQHQQHQYAHIAASPTQVAYAQHQMPYNGVALAPSSPNQYPAQWPVQQIPQQQIPQQQIPQQ